MPMIPARETTAKSATSPVAQDVVLTPFTTGMNTFASMITPRVMLIIPVTNGFAILDNSPDKNKLQGGMFKYILLYKQ